MINNELKKRLSKIRNIPTLPIVANNVIKLTQNPDSTAFEIAEAISQDQALSTRVLKTANSAYYGFPRKITTINYAIVVLGFNNIKNIALSTTIMDRFSKSDEDLLFDRKEFWKHSLLCGIISKKISERMGVKNSEEIFLCGLLHDFGKLILDSCFHDEFVLALQMSKEKNITIKKAENAIFKFNHSGVGAFVLKSWNLPQSLVKTVEFHHSPDDSLKAFRTASIVHVADYLCRKIGIGNSGDKIAPSLNKKAITLTNLTSRDIKQIIPGIITEFKSSTGFLFEGDDA